MKILGLRSVVLKQETQDAWNAAGVKFARRDRSQEQIARLIDKYDYDAILNLGNWEYDTLRFGVNVFNENDVMRAVTHPQDLRRTFGERFLPDNDTSAPHWHKSGGYGGRGVRLCEGGAACRQNQGDVQRHIDGTEYRVLTVGDKVVQASRKTNLRWENGLHYFDWDWVGVDGIRNNGIIPLIKEAVVHIPSSEYAVLGWDIIVGDRPYVIEVNTSPGVNGPTAERIVRAMKEVV